MGINEDPNNEETDKPELSLDYIKNHARTIFASSEIDFLIGLKDTYIAGYYESWPPLAAEIQEIGTDTIIIYYKSQNGDLKEISFEGMEFIPKPELIRQLNKIGFNTGSNKFYLFGIPATEAISELRRKKFHVLLNHRDK
jgi:hypothetical protein